MGGENVHLKESVLRQPPHKNYTMGTAYKVRLMLIQESMQYTT